MTAEELTVEHHHKENGSESGEESTHSSETEMTSTIPTDPVLVALMEKTGYAMIQENGQRKYGGPPPGWENKPPPRGSEVFVGKIPRDVFEDELVPVFESVGRIYEMRLMMEFDGKNRGYAFVMYTTKQDAKMAVKKLNNYEIRKGRLLGVCCSVDNCRLFVGGIPKTKKKDEIFTEMSKVTEGVMDVIVYPSASDKAKNRGFAFVEYDSHRAAAMARRKLIPGRIQLWGHPIAVDWAEPEQEVDQDIMDQVKVLYVRNLMLDTTEDKIQEVFSQYHPGTVERVKKIRDYAFVHFTSREACMNAMKMLNETKLDGTEIEVTLAKPVDKNDYNRLAKVGAKALGGVSPEATPTVVQPGVINQNGMVVYPAGITSLYNPDLTAYYPLGQYNLQTPNTRSIYPTRTLRPGRGTAAGRTTSGRNSYLGYSAGKATYGRYYAKNNQERPLVDVNGNIIEMPAVQQAGGVALYNPATSGAPIAVTQAGQPQTYVTYGTMTSHMAAATGIPGVQQTVSVAPTATIASSPSPIAILDDICQKNYWGTPTYQLLATSGQDGVQLFLYKVSIPALANLYPQQPYYQPNKLCTTVDEAKIYAAEYVLSQLSIQPEASIPMTTIIPQSPQPGIQLQNLAYAANPMGGAVRGQTSPTSIPGVMGQTGYVPVTTPSPTIPMSFVDPISMQPIAVMYQ